MASYEQNPKSKLWSVRFRQDDNETAKNKRLSGFKTKSDASKAYVSIANQKTPSAAITFEQLYIEYKANAKGRLKESSFYDVCGKIENHILPYFGKMQVAKIKPINILQWQQSLENYLISTNRIYAAVSQQFSDTRIDTTIFLTQWIKSNLYEILNQNEKCCFGLSTSLTSLLQA